MIFHQYYLECLSHASYLVGDRTTGRAVVVDPQRDVSQYLADAREAGLQIDRVVETHFHADFLSGHLELAEQTGAVISYGPGARADFPIEVLDDGARIVLGEVALEVWSTPGHTPESISILVYEHADDAVPYGVLTGDTLFIGDVGRPDLLSSIGVSADELARDLYASTRRLASLPDAVRVYPAHGAGSACGKQLSTETVSTIGEQRQTNYALAEMTEDDFVAAVTDGQPVAPLYFAFDAGRNREHRDTLDETEAPPALSLDEVLEQQRAGAVVLDTRDAPEYAAGHLRGSIEVGLGGRFAEYAGDVVRPDQPIVLIGEPGAEIEGRIRLGRIGFDNVVGYLRDALSAFADHPEHVVRSSRLTAGELAGCIRKGADLQIVDVRNPGEVRLGVIEGSTLLPLAQILERAGELDSTRPTVTVCAGGYRSAVAASVLEARGFTDVSDLLGGFDAWVAQGHPFVTPTEVPR